MSTQDKIVEEKFAGNHEAFREHAVRAYLSQAEVVGFQKSPEVQEFLNNQDISFERLVEASLAFFLEMSRTHGLPPLLSLSSPLEEELDGGQLMTPQPAPCSETVSFDPQPQGESSELEGGAPEEEADPGPVMVDCEDEEPDQAEKRGFVKTGRPAKTRLIEVPAGLTGKEALKKAVEEGLIEVREPSRTRHEGASFTEIWEPRGTAMLRRSFGEHSNDEHTLTLLCDRLRQGKMERQEFEDTVKMHFGDEFDVPEELPGDPAEAAREIIKARHAQKMGVFQNGGTGTQVVL